MKCPYMTNSVQMFTHKWRYDEDNNCTFQETELQEIHPFVDCLGPECAAWGDGCNYRGTVGR